MFATPNARSIVFQIVITDEVFPSPPQFPTLRNPTAHPSGVLAASATLVTPSALRQTYSGHLAGSPGGYAAVSTRPPTAACRVSLVVRTKKI
ncbi:hypothetical protein KC360_g111 [Hortaea werneckii]|nr:hypothetical protein KC344_g112 [Hortaea werneckii]KAI7180452.1 hypothetical protein KC360_g111 [Hortaea werneckii]